MRLPNGLANGFSWVYMVVTRVQDNVFYSACHDFVPCILTNIATLVLLKPTAGHTDATVYLHLPYSSGPTSGTLPFGFRAAINRKTLKTAKRDCETPIISPVDLRLQRFRRKVR